MEIRLLLDHRDDLVAERTRTINRLRWHLLELCPELERSLKRGAFNRARVLGRVDRRLRKLPAEARVRVARDQVARLRGLNRQIDRLKAELAELVVAHRPELLAEPGCGALTAAILIGHTAGNERFRSQASFGLQTGTAPIPCSSGQRAQHRLNRGGDRQLNHALHIIAVTRARRDPATKQYLARKEAEGKTSKGALRSLKRHLARRFYKLLSEPPADQQPARDGKPIAEPQPAAIDGNVPEIPPRRHPRAPADTNIKGEAPFPMVCIT
jgi:transposase